MYNQNGGSLSRSTRFRVRQMLLILFLLMPPYFAFSSTLQSKVEGGPQSSLTCADLIVSDGASKETSKEASPEVGKEAGQKLNSVYSHLAQEDLPYTQEDLRALQSLVATQKISASQMREIVEGQEVGILFDLAYAKKIPMELAENLSDGFIAMTHGRPIRQGLPYKIQLKDQGAFRERQVWLQEREPFDAAEYSLTFDDWVTHRPIAVIEYSITDLQKGENSQELYIVSSRSARGQRDRGLSKSLLVEILKKFPKVDTIKADLAEVNEQVLLSGINRGLSIDEAFKQTPAYKMLTGLGFTKAAIRFNDDGFYIVQAKK